MYATMNNHQDQQRQASPKMSSSPEYRSVAMSSPSMMPPPMLRVPFFQQQQQPKCKQVSFNPRSSSVPQKNSNPWTLVHPLPSVPAGHMLERNQIRIPTTTIKTPQEIANRISECLNLRSFVITETSSEIKNAFRAESCKGLLFRINFFLLQDSELLVEFQRLAGCSYEFQRTFQLVCRYAHQQQQQMVETKQELEFPTCFVPTTSSLSSRKERLLDTFSIAMDMIQSSSRLDSQLMGLEVLESMSTSLEIVPLLLSQCLATLLRFAKGSEEAQSQLKQQQECLLKRRALSILANALEQELLKSSQHLSNDHHQVIWNTLLGCLNNNNCSNDPHQSFQVVRSLVSLSKSNENLRSLLKESQVMPLLLAREGQQQTRTTHLALEQEYKKLESILLSS